MVKELGLFWLHRLVFASKGGLLRFGFPDPNRGQQVPKVTKISQSPMGRKSYGAKLSLAQSPIGPKSHVAKVPKNGSKGAARSQKGPKVAKRGQKEQQRQYGDKRG